MDTLNIGSAVRRSWPYGLVTLGLLAWLWPIGLGGAMPVGGDVTQFSMGLMAFLGRSLRAGHLPLWNDLWGYGFPGLAESQMGVFYPPHGLLYGLLPVETAYTASLVLHTLWCGLGATWAARRFGISRGGAVLAAWSWAASGFFVIHLPHQWAYTTASWMPWIWGLGWIIARGQAGRGAVLALAGSLAIQLLPGHFQIAFITQLGLGLIALAGVASPGPAAEPAGMARRARRLLLVGFAWGASCLLAACQLVPTARLAMLAEKDRTYEYLGTFATTPLHLVGYLAPGLFHRSPLWRAVVWDPLHAIPEESAGYVGLVALLLAALAVGRLWRAGMAVRALLLVALAMTALSLGPYVPGFGFLIRLPGFSFFRAPARWEVGSGLALALLAGLGFDQIRAWARPGRSLLMFVAGAAVLIGLVVGTFELALAGTVGGRTSPVAAGVDRLLALAPWSAQPAVGAMMADARRPQGGLRERSALAREGYDTLPPEGLSLENERPRIYPRELGETGVILATLLGLAVVAGTKAGRPALRPGLLALALLDLALLGRHRLVETAPLQPLIGTSAVLGRLAALPAGSRSIDPARNLPMVAGAAPVSAYRTLDLPRPMSLEQVAFQAAPGEPLAAQALRATGATVRLLDPFEASAARRERVEPVDDPALASWLYGSAWIAGEGRRRTTFGWWRPDNGPSRTWRLPPGVVLGDRDDPAAILGALESATPLTLAATDPEHQEIRLRADGPEIVLLTIQHDPAWAATWAEGGGAPRPAEIRAVLGGWMAVAVPRAGEWTLRLEYRPREVVPALAVSAVSWAIWGLAWFWPRRGASAKGAT